MLLGKRGVQCGQGLFGAAGCIERGAAIDLGVRQIGRAGNGPIKRGQGFGGPIVDHEDDAAVRVSAGHGRLQLNRFVIRGQRLGVLAQFLVRIAEVIERRGVAWVVNQRLFKRGPRIVKTLLGIKRVAAVEMGAG